MLRIRSVAIVSAALVFLAAAQFAAWGRAETFELFNGGRVEGEWLNPDESPRKTYIIRTEAGTLTLSSSQVIRVAEKSEAEIWYESHVGEVANDVASHLAMAGECAKRRLEPQRIYHLEQVLKLDPENESARRELGYSKIDGQWIRTDLWFRGRGYVKHGGKWRLPQEVALEQVKEERKTAEVKWGHQVRLWRQWILKNRDRAADGVAAIRGLDDPAAAAVLIELMDEKNEPPQLRKLYVEVVGKFPGTAVSNALVKRALADPDPQVRDKAIDQLVAREDRFAARLLIGVMSKFSSETTPIEQNVIINRAAAALGRLKMPEATLPLIDALVTKHKEVIASGGGGINPTFTNDPTGASGGGGLSFGGGGPKTITREISNATVRDALIALYPTINHGFNAEAWRRWYEQTNTPVLVDLRRDQ